MSGRANVPADAAPRWLERERFQALLDALRAGGYRVLGPTVRDGALVFDEVERVRDLAVGWRDAQEPGSYRLEASGDDRIFGVVHGARAAKPLVFAPRERLLQIEISPERRGFQATATMPASERIAVLGLRACDLAGLRVQDRVFLHDRFPDPWYAARREGLLCVAVNCTRSVSTCFCTSMGTGPEATAGFDLALTEQDDGFLVRAGSPAGEEILTRLSLPRAGEAARGAERAAIDACAAGMQRRLETDGLKELLYDRLDHPRWDDVAERCLSCGNCTLVCPTCFCHDERDEPSTDGDGSVRVREWDSCFDVDHGRVHGRQYRSRIRDRYRQWLVHKLASWQDQFGTSGCVGCGRCITWCPVGIDLVEEVAALRRDPGGGGDAR